MSEEKKGIGFGGYIGIFVAVLAAICVGVFLFAPEKLPSGVGLEPVPIEVNVRDSMVDEGKVAIIRNPTAKTLHNVLLVCTNAELKQEKRYLEETWAPNRELELGWMEGWKWVSGETLTVSASGYAEKTWRF